MFCHFFAYLPLLAVIFPFFLEKITKKEVVMKNKLLHKINLPARAGLSYTVANFVGRGISFLFTPVFTRVLTPREFSLYSLYTGWLTVISVFATPELSGGVTYRAIAELSEEAFVPNALTSSISFTLIFSVFYLLFFDKINRLTTLSTPLTLLLILQALLNSVQALFFAKERYRYKYKTVSLINIGHGLLTPLLSLALIFLFGLRREGRIYAEVIMSLILAIPMASSILKGGIKFRGEVWKYVYTVSFSMLPHFLSRAVLGQSSKLFVSRLLGQEALGKYSAINTTGFIISLALGGLSLGIAPWIARKKKDGKSEKIKDTLFALFYSVTLFASLFLFLAPEILSFIAPREYLENIGALYPIAIGATLSFASGIFTSVLLYAKRIRDISLVSVFSSVIAILSGYFLTKVLGVVGAGLSTGISYIFSSVFGYTVCKRNGEPLPDAWTSLSFLLLLCLFALISYTLKDMFILRLLVSILLSALGIRGLLKFKGLFLEKEMSGA